MSSVTLDFAGTTDGWNGVLFGGNQTIQSVSDRLVITKTGTSTASADARTIDDAGGLNYQLTDGVTYEVEIDVVSLQGGWEIRDRFSAQTQPSQSLTTGVNKFRFVRNGSIGQYPVIVGGTSVAANEAIEIEKITVTEIDTDLEDALAEKRSAMYTANWLENSEFQGVLTFGAATVVVNTSGLVYNATAGAQVVAFPYGETVGDDAYFDVFLDITLNSGSMRMQGVWGGTGNSVLFELDDPAIPKVFKGIYRVRRIGSISNTTLNELVFSSSDGSPVEAEFRSLEIYHAPPTPFEQLFVHVGEGAKNTRVMSSMSLAQQKTLGTIVGSGSVSNNSDPTLVGSDIQNVHVAYYGALGLFGAANNDGSVQIGRKGIGGGWRTSGLGALTAPLGQSATVAGYGAVSLTSHGNGWGRGAYIVDPSMYRGSDLAKMAFDVDTVIQGDDIYFENGYAHYFNLPITGIAVGSGEAPETKTKRVHGQDAYDARHPAWDAATQYTAPTSSRNAFVVQHNGFAYKSRKASIGNDGVTGFEPGTETNAAGDVYAYGMAFDTGDDPTWIRFKSVPTFGFNSGVASDFNVDGGHIRVSAGRSTGNGTGGTAGFEVTNGVDLGENTKQALIDALTVDADFGTANTPMSLLYKDDDGNLSMQRVDADENGYLRLIGVGSVLDISAVADAVAAKLSSTPTLSALIASVEPGTSIPPAYVQIESSTTLTKVALNTGGIVPGAIAIFTDSAMVSIDPASITVTKVTDTLFKVEFADPLVDTASNSITTTAGGVLQISLRFTSDEIATFDGAVKIPVSNKASDLTQTGFDATIGVLGTAINSVGTEVNKIRKYGDTYTVTNGTTTKQFTDAKV